MLLKKFSIYCLIIIFSSCATAKFKIENIKVVNFSKVKGNYLLNDFEGKSAFKINKEAYKELNAVIKDSITKISDIKSSILGL